MIKDLSRNIDRPIAPVQIFADLNWFLNFSGNNTLLCLSNLVDSPKTFSGNRFLIVGPNKINTFSIPLQKSSFGKNVSDLMISNQSKWFKELKNTLQTVYGKTPYFEYYDYKLWHVFENRSDESFLGLVVDLLEWAFKALQWEVQIQFVEDKPSLIQQKGNIQAYFQPFIDRFGFVSEAPIFDAIFCLGPEAGLMCSR
ncbi:MAG: WbqC family protein [Bacteroidetes bacterium]|nr:WbqC family protein [Bacteroidota bacterium]